MKVDLRLDEDESVLIFGDGRIMEIGKIAAGEYLFFDQETRAQHRFVMVHAMGPRGERLAYVERPRSR